MKYKNLNKSSYDFNLLAQRHDELNPYIILKHGKHTIDFSDYNAIYHLNKALLKTYYAVTDWELPKGYLCPTVPGRMKYLQILNELIQKETVHGIDIGTGASGIYCILAAKQYQWRMDGIDSNFEAYQWAKKNILLAGGISNLVSIRFQENNANIIKGALDASCHYNFTMCNPPFYSSEKEALKVSMQKSDRLQLSSVTNYGGHAKELWCNGGEALFIKRMIKESVAFKDQVTYFTCLVSNKQNLEKLVKLIRKLSAKEMVKVMTIGNKVSHILIWQF